MVACTISKTVSHRAQHCSDPSDPFHQCLKQDLNPIKLFNGYCSSLDPNVLKYKYRSMGMLKAQQKVAILHRL